MELYLDVKPVGKGSNGRTACGSSAYRGCNQVLDNEGRSHNYNRKAGHIAGGILLPVGAPSELLDPQVLWQRHDQKEIRKDAQIYREVVFALPNELPDQACIDITKELIAPLVKMGMCAQWDIHNPHDPKFDKKRNKDEEEFVNKHPENKHVHVMLTMRDLQKDGTFGKKNRSWNQYNGGINLADKLRPEAARLMNEKLEEYGFEKRVEHESYVKRGIDKIPEEHVGVIGTNMAREGRRSYRQEMRNVVKQLNEENISYLEKMDKLHEARQRLADIGVAEVTKPSIFDQIGAAETVSNLQNLEVPSGINTRIHTHYTNIKEYNQQIYELRREKMQRANWRKALYTYKNLAGDPELTVEQKKLLQWAENYIRWATKSGELPDEDRLEALIDKEREINTQRCLGIYAAEKNIRSALTDIQNEKTADWMRRNGIRELEEER